MPSLPDDAAPPARAPWPPILIALALLCGLTLDWISGGALGGRIAFSGAKLLGGVIIALALANDAWCATIFARHGTTILPHRAAARLATDGPFRWSRNPIYVSHVAVVAGVALLLASPFTLLLTPLLGFGLQKLAIEPEERHLLAKFGKEYRAYMARTRRWL
jgi:protein-S-isoprenylcysteine O-methyltransferase Ste14